MDFEKTTTEEEILTWLSEGAVTFPPLAITDVEMEAWLPGLDAKLTIRWKEKNYRFGVEVKRLSTPKSVTSALEQILAVTKPPNLYPLVVIPYLGDEQLRMLEAKNISGIDLCGNGVVVIPEEMLVFRTGLPNRFRWEGRIKNIYRGTSAIVATTFLLVSDFKSVSELQNEIRRRGVEATLPTISKVCQGLEQDLVIERSRSDTPKVRRLRVLQPEKLLDLLRDNYSPPKVTRAFLGQFNGSREQLDSRLRDVGEEKERRLVLTGTSSVRAYAVMAREDIQSFYTSDVGGIVRALGNEITKTDRFPNVQFLQTSDESVYFDKRSGLLASPVQTYLELSAGEKREKETAMQVRRFILNQLNANG